MNNNIALIEKPHYFSLPAKKEKLNMLKINFHQGSKIGNLLIQPENDNLVGRHGLKWKTPPTYHGGNFSKNIPYISYIRPEAVGEVKGLLEPKDCFHKFSSQT